MSAISHILDMPPTPKNPEEILEEFGDGLSDKTWLHEDGPKGWLRTAMASVIAWAAEADFPTAEEMHEQDWFESKKVVRSHLLALADRVSKGEKEPKLKT